MFRCGQKVLCVDGRFPPEVWERCNDVPERGKVYTVRDVIYASHYLTRVYGHAVRLVEIANPSWPDLEEAGFAVERFRAFAGMPSAAKREEAAGVCAVSGERS